MSTRCLNSQEEQAYAALLQAAERVGFNAYKAGLYKVKRDRKGNVVRGYVLTPEHQELITAINALGRGEISAEEAMALVSQYEISKARLKGY
jgi:gamma-glutamylcyclotransferase (GGCT)/AIG2-like uncharacterized protein YtfP